jgi:hypothetical protein
MTLTVSAGGQEATIRSGGCLTVGRSRRSDTHLHAGDDQSLSRIAVTIFHVGDHWRVRGTARKDGHKVVVRNGGEVIQLPPGIPQLLVWDRARLELPFGTPATLHHLVVLVRADLTRARWTGLFIDPQGPVVDSAKWTDLALRRTWASLEDAPRRAVYATACAVPILQRGSMSATEWTATKAKEAFNAWYQQDGNGPWGRTSADAVKVLGCDRAEVPAEAVRRGFVTPQDVDALLQRYATRRHYQGLRR